MPDDRDFDAPEAAAADRAPAGVPLPGSARCGSAGGPTAGRASHAAPPSFVELEPVGQCNLRCQMCPSPLRRDGPPWGPPALMEWETFTRLMDQLRGVAELRLQGLGEPALHPRFFDMIAFAARRGMRVSAASNCTQFGGARVERLVTSGLWELRASIDGATRETFEAIRTGGRFARVLRALAALERAKRRLGSERPGVTLVAVAMRENLQELPAIVRLARRLGIGAVYVQQLGHAFLEPGLPGRYSPMRETARAQSIEGEEPERVAYYFSRAREAARACEVELRLPAHRPKGHPPGTPGRRRCGRPWSGAYLSYQGLAMPCEIVGTPGRSGLGDVARDGLSRVWNGEAYGAFRESLGSEDPPQVCRSCAVYRGTF